MRKSNLVFCRSISIISFFTFLLFLFNPLTIVNTFGQVHIKEKVEIEPQVSKYSFNTSVATGATLRIEMSGSSGSYGIVIIGTP